MKYGYSLLLTEKIFTKILLKGFDAEKLRNKQGVAFTKDVYSAYRFQS
jgi:hypothetical protein